MKTTRYLSFTTLLLLVLASISCQKNPTNPTNPSNEDTLTVQTSPVTTNNNVEAPAPGPTFPLKVTITSKMPASGVKIDVKANPDGTATAFYSESRNSTAAVNDFTITNTPKTVVCVVTITVTSVSNTSNKWTGSYRYSSK